MVTIPILRTTAELHCWRNQQKDPIHFVPTMGALHQGHSKLIGRAHNNQSDKSKVVLISIFVNPLQFGENEDFLQYPRNLENDSEIAYKAGAHAIWAPLYEDLFPGGPESNFQIKAPKKLQTHLCGAYRKGHFDGVATVVTRLLTIVKPKVIYLGEKDWQQLVIIRKLIDDFCLPVEVQAVSTFRDVDGLAYSSRNSYLKKNERTQAIGLPQALKQASQNFQNGETIDLKKIKLSLEKNDLQVEYLEVLEKSSLMPISTFPNLSLLAAAVKCGTTRLIDHTFLMSRLPIVAIDGPAGAGKSTVTRAFAKKLGLLYLDTGAMYRAVTWLIQKHKIDINNEKILTEVLSSLKLDLKISNGMQNIIVNNQNITNEIRSPEISRAVSTIATNKIVRETLTSQQQKIGINGGLVAEGRDIGTAVFPDAELKVFLTASPKERALRRSIDLKKQGYTVPNLMDLEKEIQTRDYQDSTRKISPLIKAKDAKELVTDGMNIDQVIQTLIDMFRNEIPDEVWPIA